MSNRIDIVIQRLEWPEEPSTDQMLTAAFVELEVSLILNITLELSTDLTLLMSLTLEMSFLVAEHPDL